VKGERPIIFIVDDDPSVRRALRRLVRSWGWDAQTFASADEFLSAWSPAQGGCLILDVRLPGMSGLELQELLEAAGARLPIILITAHGDRQAEARGRHAVAFLYKPFDELALKEALRKALCSDDQRHPC
jgi:FixJ family two-component response regulator